MLTSILKSKKPRFKWVNSFSQGHGDGRRELWSPNRYFLWFPRIREGPAGWMGTVEKEGVGGLLPFPGPQACHCHWRGDFLSLSLTGRASDSQCPRVWGRRPSGVSICLREARAHSQGPSKAPSVQGWLQAGQWLSGVIDICNFSPPVWPRCEGKIGCCWIIENENPFKLIPMKTKLSSTIRHPASAGHLRPLCSQAVGLHMAFHRLPAHLEPRVSRGLREAAQWVAYEPR